MKRTIVCRDHSMMILASTGSMYAWLHTEHAGARAVFAADARALDKIIAALQDAKAALPAKAEDITSGKSAVT